MAGAGDGLSDAAKDMADDDDLLAAAEDDELTETVTEMETFLPTCVTPCLMLDRDKLQRNIDDMTARIDSIGLRLRPHMKTHKCLAIGKMQTSATKRCIAVATIAEAEYFADGDFDDIHCTALFTSDKIQRMLRLGHRLDRFLVMVDSDYHVDLLIDNQLTGKKWVALLKVDVGARRGGVLWDADAGVQLATRMADSMAIQFEGLYAHERHAYQARGRQAVSELGAEAAVRLLQLAKRITDAGIRCTSVGLGSTPTATMTNAEMNTLTELHPGNYVYYDAMQCVIGSTIKENIALKIATRVIGHYPHRNQLLIDAGFTAVSHDGKGCLDGASYCYFDGHPNLRLKTMHQEVGLVEPKDGQPIDYSALPIGSILYMLPYHSCATAMMHEHVWVYTSEGVVARWNLGARGVW